MVGPDTILTAAHVVAGSQSLQVLPPNSTHNKTATLVYFNPQIDIALLHVQGLNITPLKPATSTPARGELVAEIGYPNGGKGQILPGRIRASFEAVGSSLYGKSLVRRSLLLLSANTEPGVSGGAVVTNSGLLIGMVFASAPSDPTTGYALSESQLSPVLSSLKNFKTPVSSKACLTS